MTIGSYRVSGSGPAIVLSHGVIENSASWEDAIPVLERSFTVVSYDARGRGRRACEATPMPFGYKELVEDVEELVERLGFEHFFHAGHSMGGRIALEHALTYPDRVAGIAVISARAQAPDAADRERLRALIAACEDEGSAAAVSGWASEGSEEYERVRSISADNPVRGTVAALEVLISAQSLVPRLVDIDIPTLVVAGACDGRYTRSAEEMAMAIPDSLLCILEGVGHFPNIECAEILAGELTTFFTAVNARGKGRL